MHRLLQIHEPGMLDQWSTADGLSSFDSGCLARHTADAHWVALDSVGRIAGRVSAWWRQTPEHPAGRLGYIGHYGAADDTAGRQLLDAACRELAAQGCALAAGPIDGSTWRNYRFVTGGDSSSPFFLEPVNPAAWPRHFGESGFSSMAGYYSSVDEDLARDDDERGHRAADRLSKIGVTLRPLGAGNFAGELQALHPLISACFQGGYLYQPLPEGEFTAQYEAIRPYVNPELVMIAMHEERPVGLIFTLADALQARADRPVDTAIIKTLCVLPERRYAGLGSFLVAANRRRARALGYRRLIHALMHEANKSLSISARYGDSFRRYTLFSKPL
jgi:GNAT superfamily N-acetyltransferase